MDPIKGIDQVAQLLRQKLDRGKSSIGKTSSDKSASIQGAPAQKTAKTDAEAVKRKIGERIRALPEEDRNGPKAAKIFVELVITWEFGEQLLQDPQLADLSGEVVNTMTDNPALWNQMQTMLTGLGRKP